MVVKAFSRETLGLLWALFKLYFY